MENSVIILWIPLIVIVVMSIIKLINKRKRTGKSWIRIEEVEDDE
jgi:hypothetical protein